MWQVRYEKTYAKVTRNKIWAAWADVNNWSRWDEDLEFAKISGGFGEGREFILKPKGGPRVKIKITRAEPDQAFTDVTTFPLARMVDDHEMEDTPDGLKLISTIRVEGPLAFLWKKLVVEDVAKGVPKQMDALVQFALQSK